MPKQYHTANIQRQTGETFFIERSKSSVIFSELPDTERAVQRRQLAQLF